MFVPLAGKPKDVLVATHGHCFDGMASAVLFTRLRRAIDPSLAAPFRYKSCGYGPQMQTVPEAWLDGGENAILDFRYTESPRLRWYFDHHATAFGSDEERARAASRASNERAPLEMHFDAKYGSCTKLIADVARNVYEAPPLGLDELVTWADKIDSARFESAEEATRRDEPALQLAAVIEHHGDTAFLGEIVPRLLEAPLAEVAKSAAIQSLYAPLVAAFEAFTTRVEHAAKDLGPVVLVDLSDGPVLVSAKFVTYALYPRARYSVTVLRNKHHVKISVGYNPWCGSPREHDISAICKRYGGGGHAAVGACSFPHSMVEKAREAAAAIVKQLGG